MPIDPRTPVIVGVAQRTQSREALPGPEPLQAWEESCRMAIEDAGLSRILEQLTSNLRSPEIGRDRTD